MSLLPTYFAVKINTDDGNNNMQCIFNSQNLQEVKEARALFNTSYPDIEVFIMQSVPLT